MPTAKVRDIIKEIEALGWVYAYTRGDHRQYVHPVLGGKVTIPGKLNKDLGPGLVKSIRDQARGTPERGAQP